MKKTFLARCLAAAAILAVSAASVPAASTYMLRPPVPGKAAGVLGGTATATPPSTPSAPLPSVTFESRYFSHYNWTGIAVTELTASVGQAITISGPTYYYVCQIGDGGAPAYTSAYSVFNITGGPMGKVVFAPKAPGDYKLLIRCIQDDQDASQIKERTRRLHIVVN